MNPLLTPMPDGTVPVVVPQLSPTTPPDPQPLDSAAAIAARLDELTEYAQELNRLDDELLPPAITSATTLSLPTDFLLSIVVPIFNEQATVRAIVAKLLALPLPKELILVDDGSTDGTRAELARLQGLPDVKIVCLPTNQGKGAALRTGFQHARGSIVLVQDADLEYDPRDIPELLTPILSGEADVVYGSRFLERRWLGSSACHRLGNRLLTAASNLTTGLRLTDMETCYKVFHSSALATLTIRQDRFGFEPEVTAKLARRGLRFRELPVRYRARDWDAGKKIGWRDALNAFYCIVRYAWID